MKSCPFCAEQIQDSAIKCRYCGSMLGAPPVAVPVPSDPALDAEVRRLMGTREKINAIKLVRERTGIGLAEAKAYVEAVEHGLDPRTAVQMATHLSAGKRGVPIVALVVAALLAALAIVFLSRP